MQRKIQQDQALNQKSSQNFNQELQAIVKYMQERQARQAKKIIIVIGKMGAGKSSFIKMLVKDQLKSSIIAQESPQSVTKFCSLYQMSQEAKKRLQIPKQQGIYILDTPGINSTPQNYSIIQQIISFILIQKCQIIAITYIRNSTDLRQSQSSSYIDLHKIFPIKKQIKDKISCLIFSKFDRQLQYLKEFQNNKTSLFTKFENQKINFVKECNLTWISFPSDQKDLKEIQQFIKKDQEASDHFQKQWINLGNSLKNRNQIKCSYKQFQQAVTQYKNKIQQEIIKILKNSENKQSVQETIYFEFETVKQIELPSIMDALLFAGPIVAPFFIIGVLISKGFSLFKNIPDNKNRREESQEQSVVNLTEEKLQQKQNQKFQQMMIKVLKNQCLKSILQHKNYKQHYLTLKIDKWIEDVIVHTKKNNIQKQYISIYKFYKNKITKRNYFTLSVLNKLRCIITNKTLNSINQQHEIQMKKKQYKSSQSLIKQNIVQGIFRNSISKKDIQKIYVNKKNSQNEKEQIQVRSMLFLPQTAYLVQVKIKRPTQTNMTQIIKNIAYQCYFKQP